MAFVQSDGAGVPHATDHIDLFDLWHTFLLANGAVELEYVAGTQNYVKLLGSGSDEIIFGAQVFTDTPLNCHAWILDGLTGFSSGADWGQQLGSLLVSPPALPLFDSVIPYFFWCSSRRAIVVAKVGSIYVHMYAGLYLAYSTPSQQPYPLCVSGSTYRGDSDGSTFQGKPYLFSNVDGRTSAYWNPIYNGISLGTLFVRDNSGWKRLRNVPTADFKYSGTRPYYLPYADNTRRAPDGTYPLQEIEIIDGGDPPNTLGVFEGVYFLPGDNLSPESIITIGGDDFIVFPNASRSSVGNWCAIKVA